MPDTKDKHYIIPLIFGVKNRQIYKESRKQKFLRWGEGRKGIIS
jgi:hypothetical protein